MTRKESPINNFGQDLRQRRDTHNLTQEAFGQLFKPPLNPSFISRVETGKRHFSQETATQAVDILGVPKGKEKTLFLLGAVGFPQSEIDKLEKTIMDTPSAPTVSEVDVRATWAETASDQGQMIYIG